MTDPMKFSDKIIARLAYSYAKATNPDVRYALQNGLVTEQELLRQAQQGVANADREIQSKKAAQRSSSGTRRCCANCHYYMTSPYFGYPFFCAKHDIKFSYDDIEDDVPVNSCCENYSQKGYW